MNNNITINRRRSIRLPDYDYSQEGKYFVTICSYDKKCIFGKIIDDQMIPNELGEVVKACWNNIPSHFSQATVDLFVLMPNHVHGVISIEDRAVSSPSNSQYSGCSNTIGSIVRGFKIGVTKWVKANTDLTVVWQRNYYEHIIRNEREYLRIYEYVVNNPLQWSLDHLNPECKNVNILPL